MNQDHRIAQQIVQFNFVNPQLVQQALNSPHRQAGQNLCAFLCQAGYLTTEQAHQVQAALRSSPNLQHTLLSSQGTVPHPQPSPASPEDNLYAAHFDKVIERGEKLGEGGMGVVYRVIDKRLNRPAALKLLHKASQNKLTAARFLREASITARLDHPCIPPVYEVGRTPDGELYLLMRIIEGDTLTARIDEYHQNQRPARALNEILDILIKVCEAIDYAHGHRILHRDLKPDNIMVGPFGEALVLDWGLARDMDSGEEELPSNDVATTVPDSGSTKLTQAGALIGTLGYMPPEQAGGEDMDEGVDIFALGAILTVALTGRRPIEGDTVMSMVTATCEGRIKSPKEILSSVPSELNTLACWALETEREDRPKTVRDWLSELKAFRQQEQLSRHKYSLFEKFQRSLSKHPVLFSAICALVFFASIIVFLYNQYSIANEQKQYAEAQSELAQSNLERSKAVLNSLAKARALVRQKAPKERIIEALENALKNGERSYPLLLSVSEILYQGRCWQRAIEYLKEAEKANPPAYEALFLQHQLLVEQNPRTFFTTAIQRLIESAKKSPEESFYPLFAKALDHDQKRDDEAAARLYKALDQLPRKDAIVDVFRGNFLTKMGDYKGSLKFYNRAIEIAPRSCVAHIRKGETLINLGRFKEALKAFNRCLEIDDKLWIPYRYLGQLYSLQFKWDVALVNYTKAIELKPEYSSALAGRAYAYTRLGQPRNAQQDIERAIRLDPENLEVVGTQASIHLGQGKEALAFQELKVALEKYEEKAKDPQREFQDSATLYNMMANIYTKRKQLNLAIETYTRALAANPTNTKAYTSRAYCYGKQGKIERALEDFKKAISIDSEFFRPYYNRGTLMLNLKRYEEALKDLDKVIALNPPILALAYAKRGEVKRELKDYRGSLQDFKQALARNPNNYGVYGNRADVYMRLGETRKAINDFETFVEYMPNHPVAKMVKKQLPRLRASLKQKESER